MTRVLEVGYSPCPNDTFMFHALVHGLVPLAGLRLVPWLGDIEALNQRALDPRRRLPVSKLSLPALAQVARHYCVLDAGAALGRGCGPLVVRAAERRELADLADLAGRRIAIPGELTTAFLLLRCFGPQPLHVVPMRFERIMPAVARGEVDAGLVIHESRFTFRDHGLVQLCDLGESWEHATGLPLPLGVIAAARELGEPVVQQLTLGLRASIATARRDPEPSRAYVAQHAHELAAEVCQQHIDLYVNEFSLDLGAEGRAAVDALLQRGAAVGLLPGGVSPW